MGYGIADAFSGGGTDYGQIALQQEQARQAAINTGTTAISNAYSGFTPDFYSQRAKAYDDFALPQLANQYQQTQNDIGFDMGNRNLLGGSAARTAFSNLNTNNDQAKQGIVDAGIQQSQSLENQVNASKDQQLNYLYQTADPAGAGAGATADAASFAAPSTFAPLVNQFNSLISQYYAQQLINNYQSTSYVQPPGEGGSSAPIGGSQLSTNG